MKESAKRILALVLSFVMIFTSLPVIASAATDAITLYGKNKTYTIDRGVGDHTLKDLEASNSNVTVKEGDKNLTHWYADIIVTSNKIGSSKVSWKDGNSKKSQDFEVVEARPVVAISNKINNNIILDGQSYTYKYNFDITPQSGDGEFFNKDSVKSNFTWSSSDSDVVSVDASGNITAKKAGSAVITIGWGNYTDSETLNVYNKGVEKVEITNKITEMLNTETYDFNELVTVKGDVSREVTWSSSDTSVATVDQNGVVTPVIGGAIVDIIATSIVDSTKYDSVRLNIKWASNVGGSIWEHINVTAKDTEGNLIPGVKVTVTLQDFAGVKRNGFLDWENVYDDKHYDAYTSAEENELGKCSINIHGCERFYDIKAEKEGYQVYTNVIDEYIGAFAGSNEYVTVVMVPLNYTVKVVYDDDTFDTTSFKYGEGVQDGFLSSFESKAKEIAQFNENNFTFLGWFDEDDNEITDEDLKDIKKNYTISPKFEVKYHVNYVYENNSIASFDVMKDDKLNANMLGTAMTEAEVLARTLSANDEVYNYTFAGFDKDLEDKEITEDTTVNAIMNKTLKGNTAVNFYKDEDGKEVLLTDDEFSNKQVAKQWVADNSNDFNNAICGRFANTISNNVVKSITKNDNEIRIVFATIKYTVKFVDEKDETKEIKPSEEHFVLDLVNNDNFTEYNEDMNNITSLSKQYNWIANVKIEKSEESYVYDNFKFDNIIKLITVLFTKKIANPIELRQVLDFSNCPKSDDDSTRYPAELVKIEEPRNIQKADIDHTDIEAVRNAYYSYRLNDDEYRNSDIVYSNENGKEAITIKYWAKRVNINYVLVDDNDQVVTEDKEKVYRIVNFVEYRDTKDNYEDILKEDGLKPEYKEYNGAKYAFEKVEVVKAHSCTGINSEADHNVINLVLTYKFNLQDNCNHTKTHFEDNDDNLTHKEVCDECKKVVEAKIEHNYPSSKDMFVRHTCEDCGHIMEGKAATFKMDVVSALISTDVNGAYLAQSINKYAYEIAKAIEESDDYNAAKDENAKYAEIPADDVKTAMFRALTDVANYDEDEATIRNVYLDTPVGVWYNLSVVLKLNEASFKQIEIKNDTRMDSVLNTAVQDIKRQVETNEFKLPKDLQHVEYEFTDEQGNVVQTLEYGKVYTLTIWYYVETPDALNTSEELKLSGKVHLYHGSSKKKKKNTDLPDGLLPQGGAGIADLRSNRPDDMLTRSEFIGVLSEIFTVLDTENYKDFGDINGDANELAIKKLSSFGIVQGYCEDTFGPNDFITREQMYTFIARALKFSGKASQLTDEQIDAALSKVLDKENVADWAKDGVATSIEKELVNETEKAQDTIKRVEAADKLEKFAAILFTEEEIK